MTEQTGQGGKPKKRKAIKGEALTPAEAARAMRADALRTVVSVDLTVDEHDKLAERVHERANEIEEAAELEEKKRRGKWSGKSKPRTRLGKSGGT